MEKTLKEGLENLPHLLRKWPHLSPELGLGLHGVSGFFCLITGFGCSRQQMLGWAGGLFRSKSLASLRTPPPV